MGTLILRNWGNVTLMNSKLDNGSDAVEVSLDNKWDYLMNNKEGEVR